MAIPTFEPVERPEGQVLAREQCVGVGALKIVMVDGGEARMVEGVELGGFELDSDSEKIFEVDDNMDELNAASS